MELLIPDGVFNCDYEFDNVLIRKTILKSVINNPINDKNSVFLIDDGSKYSFSY